MLHTQWERHKKKWTQWTDLLTTQKTPTLALDLHIEQISDMNSTKKTRKTFVDSLKASFLCAMSNMEFAIEFSLVSDVRESTRLVKSVEWKDNSVYHSTIWTTAVNELTCTFCAISNPRLSHSSRSLWTWMVLMALKRIQRFQPL